MKPWTVLSRAKDAVKYLQAGRQRRLYKQWVEQAELPPEPVSEEEVSPQVTGGEERKPRKQSHVPILYMLLGTCLVILCLILALLIIQSC